MTQLYIERYGKPLALIQTSWGVFKVNMKEAESGTGFTQFGRAMEELGIELICAHSPQAKGRVERANNTLQDRLVKELRLEGISDIETANRFLDGYIDKHNAKFAVSAKETTDVHQRIEALEELQLHFTLQEIRKVQKNLTIQYKNKIYCIQMPGKGYRLRQAEITVCEDKSGKITLLHKGQSLDYIVYDKKQYRQEIVNAKELSSHLQSLKTEPKQYRPSATHPWKSRANRGTPTGL